MSTWTPQDWIIFFSAVSSFLAALAATVAAFIANLAKLRGETNTVKLDENTKLTVEGTQQATVNAKVAADTAQLAADKAIETKREVSNQFNGILDAKINGIVRQHLSPLERAMNSHAEQDDKNMKEIREALIDLKNRIK